MELYPNPASTGDGMMITVNNPVSNTRFTINFYNQWGKKIHRINGTSSGRVQQYYQLGSEFQSGFYFLEFYQLDRRDVQMFIVHE